jgi:hypothetical protein
MDRARCKAYIKFAEKGIFKKGVTVPYSKAFEKCESCSRQISKKGPNAQKSCPKS